MIYKVALAAFAAVALAHPAAEPQTSPLASPAGAVIPDYAIIENVTFAGTGCPPGSGVWQLTDDKQTLGLTFSQFVAQYYKDAPFSTTTSNCNVQIKVKVPKGITVTVATTNVRGFAKIDKTCTATVGGKVWWSGSQQQATCQTSIGGPATGDFLKTMSVPTIAWSKCGADGPLLNVNTRLLADCTNEKKKALINTEEIDTQLDTPFHWDLGLVYGRC